MNKRFPLLASPFVCLLVAAAFVTAQPPAQSQSATANDIELPAEKHLRNVRQLTTSGENAEAYFSGDGRKLIFQSKNAGMSCDQIFTMNADGSGRRRLVDHPERSMSWQLDWSPDGRRIAYVFYPEARDPFTEYRVVGRNGRGRRVVDLPRRLEVSRWVDWGG